MNPQVINTKVPVTKMDNPRLDAFNIAFKDISDWDDGSPTSMSGCADNVAVSPLPDSDTTGNLDRTFDNILAVGANDYDFGINNFIGTGALRKNNFVWGGDNNCYYYINDIRATGGGQTWVELKSDIASPVFPSAIIPPPAACVGVAAASATFTRQGVSTTVVDAGNDDVVQYSRRIPVTSASGFAVGDLIEISDTTNSSFNRIMQITTRPTIGPGGNEVGIVVFLLQTPIQINA